MEDHQELIESTSITNIAIIIAAPPISKKTVNDSYPNIIENKLPKRASVETIIETLLGEANLWHTVWIV